MLAPTICICTAAAKTDLNRVWDAMGQGPNTFSVALCADDPGATWETPPTHYLMQDMGAQQTDVDIWTAMAQNNDLPPISGVWGEDGVITAAEAQTAISSGNLFVFPAYGLQTYQDRDNWKAGVLSGTSLIFVPDEF